MLYTEGVPISKKNNFLLFTLKYIKYNCYKNISILFDKWSEI